MLKDGIHSARSTNWKSGELGSKSTHNFSDRTKTMSEVQSAIERAFFPVVASSPRVTMMRTAPTSGRKVMRERIGIANQPADQTRRYHVTKATTPTTMAKA